MSSPNTTSVPENATANAPAPRSGRGAIVAVVLGVWSIITFGNTIPMMFVSFYFADVGVSEAWRNVLFVVGCSVLPSMGIVLGCYNTNSHRPRLAITAIAICSFALCFAIVISLLCVFIYYNPPPLNFDG